MSKNKYIPVVILVILVIQALLVIMFPDIFKVDRSRKPEESRKALKYVPIGDSYTIGLGVDEQSRWPNLMVASLKEKGIDVELVANPAVSGYTVRDVIDYELPEIEKIKPDFVTVFIGANDNFAQRPVADFRHDLQELLDGLSAILVDPTNIVLVTLPDYSKSPAVNGEDGELSDFIEDYNQVIKDEAQKRELMVADIYRISQTMTGYEDYIEDGLHPSPLGYGKWESIISPVVLELLNKII